jgi:hypothetical protein
MQDVAWFPDAKEVDVPSHIRYDHCGCVHQHASLLSTNNTPCDNGRTTRRERWRFAWIHETFDDTRSRVRFSMPPICIGGFIKRADAAALVCINLFAREGLLDEFDFGPSVKLVWCHGYAHSLTMETPCGSSVTIIVSMRIMVIALKKLADKIVMLGVE